MDLVLKLREIRRLRGLSQKDVARMSGVGEKTISSFETGQRIGSLKLAQLKRMLAVYGLTEFYRDRIDRALRRSRRSRYGGESDPRRRTGPRRRRPGPRPGADARCGRPGMRRRMPRRVTSVICISVSTVSSARGMSMTRRSGFWLLPAKPPRKSPSALPPRLSACATPKAQ